MFYFPVTDNIIIGILGMLFGFATMMIGAGECGQDDSYLIPIGWIIILIGLVTFVSGMYQSLVIMEIF